MKKTLLLFSLVAFMIAGNQTNAQIVFFVEEPASLTGSYEFTYGDDAGGWGYDMDTMNVTGCLAIVDDGSSEDSLGCGTLINGAVVAGKIAVVYRGVCQFGTKALNAQNAGAIGVIIINNMAGGPVGMAPGDDGGNVNIPVIMIGSDDGALLRPAIDNGCVQAFIGNKTGLYGSDLGFLSGDVVYPRIGTFPSVLADANFFTPVQGWVYNNGGSDQTNVRLTARITYNGDGSAPLDTIYNVTSVSGLNLPAGDSAYIVHPDFSQTAFNPGFYTLTYTIESDSTDEFPADNTLSNTFWINDSLYYSTARFDPVTGMPTTNSSLGSPTVEQEFRACMILDIADAYGQSVHGISFAAVRSDGPTEEDLTDAFVVTEFYEWNDVITPTSISFSDLNLVESSFYTFDSNLQNQYVSVPFLDSIALQDNSRYLACVHINQIDNNYLRLAADGRHDYFTSSNVYIDSLDTYYGTVYPLQDITGVIGNQTPGQWYLYGGTAPAIITHLAPPREGMFIEEEEEEETNITEREIAKQDITPYPNPTNSNISIPLKNTPQGEVELRVYDLTGKMVYTEMINMSAPLLDVNTNALGNGTYFFKLRFEDNSMSSFPVVIAR